MTFREAIAVFRAMQLEDWDELTCDAFERAPKAEGVAA